jgi:hypothetical protein
MMFVHDAMHTNLCLQFDPEDIATTAVYLAGQYARKSRPVGGTTDCWMEVLGQQPDVNTLTSIAVPLIDVIIANRKSDAEEKAAVFTKIKNDLTATLLQNESKQITETSTSDPSWKRRRTD